MSLDKAIKYGKEHRKQYRGAKAVDPHCRNHGDCLYCLRGRMHHANVELEKAKYSEEEYKNE